MLTTTADDVPLLYWTAVSWAAAISLSKDDPELIGDLPLVESLIYRALELDESYDFGVIHNFLISYEMSKMGTKEDLAFRARQHFDRAVALSEGHQAAPYVTFAEAVLIPQQNRKDYQTMLEHALQIEINAHPEWRLVNLVMQRRAILLLARIDDYFVDE